MDNNSDLMPVLQKLIDEGMVERHGDIAILTPKGRTDALLRWRGLLDDAKILFSLWLKEHFDKQK